MDRCNSCLLIFAVPLSFIKKRSIEPLQTNKRTVPLSVCIVTNKWQPGLDAIVARFSDIVSEIRIGYDGDLNEISGRENGMNVLVTKVRWEGYSATKNKLAAAAVKDWILSLDSDEVPDPTLIEAICGLDFTTLSPETQFSLKRYSFFEGKMIKHGSWGNDRVLRLYNRKHSAWDNAPVHESLTQTAGTVRQKLKGLLLHYTADDYQTFTGKLQRYARLSAEKYFQQGKKATLVKRYLSPLFSFIKEFIFQLGFLDGLRGWKIARGNAVYTWWKYRFLKEKEKAGATAHS